MHVGSNPDALNPLSPRELALQDGERLGMGVTDGQCTARLPGTGEPALGLARDRGLIADVVEEDIALGNANTGALSRFHGPRGGTGA